MKQFLSVILFFFGTSLYAQQQLFWFTTNKKMGFRDAQGNIIIRPAFIYIENFSEGLACAGIGTTEETGLYGFINPKGDWVIMPQYNSARSFSNGLAAVMMQGYWGYIDTAGKWVMRPQYHLAGPFS